MQTINIGKLKINWRGSYSSTAIYNKNDAVTKNCSVFLCKQESQGNDPVINTDYFELMACGCDQLIQKGDLLHHDGNGTTALAIGAESQFLKVVNGDIGWDFQNGRSGCSVQSFVKNDTLSPAYTSCFLMEDGSIRACGEGTDGINGSAFNKTFYTPTAVSVDSTNPPQAPFIAIYQNFRSFFAITEDGDVYSWGKNAYGELGHGDLVSRPVATLIEFFREKGLKVKEISCGRNCTLDYSQTYFICDDGAIYACGYNAYGQLGDGTTTTQTTPVSCGSLKGIKKLVVSASRYSSVYAIDEYDQLWAWGYNAQGQLGLGDAVSRSSPIKITSLQNVIDVDAYTSSDVLGFAIALLESGRIFTVGHNNHSQLGVGDTVAKSSFTEVSGDFPTPIKVHCGAYNASFIDEENQLWAWGNNACGQLGLEDTTTRTGPVCLTGDFQGKVKKAFFTGTLTSNTNIIVLDSDNNIWGAGYCVYCQLARGTNINSINSIFEKFISAYSHIDKEITDIAVYGTGGLNGIFALLSDGQALACGFNTTYGMLGTQFANLDKVGTLLPILF